MVKPMVSIMDLMSFWTNFWKGVPFEAFYAYSIFTTALGVAIALFHYSGFTVVKWRLGRFKQRWDARAASSIAVILAIAIVADFIGGMFWIVPGAQSMEFLKDMTYIGGTMLFGYPVVATIFPLYVLSDAVMGVFNVLWLPGYIYLSGYNAFWFWTIGKNPDFRKPRTWAIYIPTAIAFMFLDIPGWGWLCGPASGAFPSEISYFVVVPAIFFTCTFTVILMPFVMLVVLPIAKRYRVFWAEIPGFYRQRYLGSAEWVWESGKQ